MVRNCAPENLGIPGSPFGRRGMTLQADGGKLPNGPAFRPADVRKSLKIGLRSLALGTHPRHFTVPRKPESSGPTGAIGRGV